MKSITQCLITFPLTAHPLELHKTQTLTGSLPSATEMKATSDTSAHLLMQLHNVTSRFFVPFFYDCYIFYNYFVTVQIRTYTIDIIWLYYCKNHIRELAGWLSLFCCWSSCWHGLNLSLCTSNSILTLLYLLAPCTMSHFSLQNKSEPELSSHWTSWSLWLDLLSGHQWLDCNTVQ